MKRIAIAALVIVAASTLVSAQYSKSAPKPTTKGAFQTLQAAGNFKTFLRLLEKAGFSTANCCFAPQQAGPGGGPHTILAPNDEGFAKLPKGTVEALLKNQVRLKSFLLSHILPGKVMVKDMFEPVENSNKEFKSAQGYVLGFQCNGRHSGMHNPTINGKARVGKFQDVMASNNLIVIHEIDAVLIQDDGL